jgi:rod shape determining protein RodA
VVAGYPIWLSYLILLLMRVHIILGTITVATSQIFIALISPVLGGMALKDYQQNRCNIFGPNRDPLERDTDIQARIRSKRSMFGKGWLLGYPEKHEFCQNISRFYFSVFGRIWFIGWFAFIWRSRGFFCQLIRDVNELKIKERVRLPQREFWLILCVRASSYRYDIGLVPATGIPLHF